MKTRTKLSIPIVIFIVGMIITPSPYELNADNQEIPVSCEQISNEDRGLDITYKQEFKIEPCDYESEIISYNIDATKEEDYLSTKEEPINRWGITLTEDEIDLLAKIVWLEARGEDVVGKEAIVEVCLNRIIHWDLKGSLYDVLSRKKAFSTWKNRKTAKPTEDEYKAIHNVLNGETEILDFDVVYFSTFPRNDLIARHIGNHYFCYYELTNPQEKE